MVQRNLEVWGRLLMCSTQLHWVYCIAMLEDRMYLTCGKRRTMVDLDENPLFVKIIKIMKISFFSNSLSLLTERCFGHETSTIGRVLLWSFEQNHNLLRSSYFGKIDFLIGRKIFANSEILRFFKKKLYLQILICFSHELLFLMSASLDLQV